MSTEEFSYRALKDDVSRNQNNGAFSSLMSLLCPCCEIDDDQIQDYEVQNILTKNRDPTIKLLLLGSGDSGKSTILKQIKIIHQKGYSKREIEKFKSVVCINSLSSIKLLIKNMEPYEIEFTHNENAKKAETITSITEQTILKQSCEILTPNLAEDIKSVWEDEGIKQVYGFRSDFNLIDSANYFLDKITTIGSKDYQPSQQDILRTRQKTVGIVETDFSIDGRKFRIVDVGGQRNERRKWIHSFDDVTAVIFVTSLSEYNQKMVEDSKQIRMMESILLFNETVNSRFFRNTPIIIFFNKDDIFREKIQKIDLKCCFPEYKGGSNYDKAIKYIHEQFVNVDKNKSRQIFTHITCATDTKAIKVVIEAVKNIILRQVLFENDLL
eukprot:gene8268-93_t